jgi:hypothetical protein
MVPLAPLFASTLPLLAALFVHPHHPKAIVVGGAAGKVTLTYFTVPYNGEQLERNAKDGFSWHLGFAVLDSEVPLVAGQTAVPAGRWKWDVRCAGEPKDQRWDVQLVPFELWQARRARRGEAKEAADQQLADARAKVMAAGLPEEVLLPTVAIQGAAAEHLTVGVMHSGYAAVERFSTKPQDGVELTVRMSFGSLHRELGLKEKFEVKK